METRRADDDEIIQLEKRALERWCRGDPSGFLEICGFRPMPITDSGASRSPIPVQGDHGFRSKPIAERMTL